MKYIAKVNKLHGLVPASSIKDYNYKPKFSIQLNSEQQYLLGHPIYSLLIFHFVFRVKETDGKRMGLEQTSKCRTVSPGQPAEIISCESTKIMQRIKCQS
jgi:hypothetical protein